MSNDALSRIPWEQWQAHSLPEVEKASYVGGVLASIAAGVAFGLDPHNNSNILAYAGLANGLTLPFVGAAYLPRLLRYGDANDEITTDEHRFYTISSGMRNLCLMLGVGESIYAHAEYTGGDVKSAVANGIVALGGLVGAACTGLIAHKHRKGLLGKVSGGNHE